MTIAVIDYGMGNLGSVRRALELLGERAVVAADPAMLDDCSAAILPGVGAFADGMSALRTGGWDAALSTRVASGMPLLGICLGMQLLAGSGGEGGETAGLALVPGRVRHLSDAGCELRIPHVGWNSIGITRENALAPSSLNGADFYFVHSFAFYPDDSADVIATCDYGVVIPAAVARDRVFGTQFHPEKSSKAGFEILRSFAKSSRC